MSLALVLIAASFLGLVTTSAVPARHSKAVIFPSNASDSSNIHDGIGAGIDLYRMYKGDGSVADGWPTMDHWVSFEDMFNANKVIMRNSCSKIGADCGDDDSEEEIGHIWDAIQSTANKTLIDHRFILAVMLQESGGCVRVRTTYNPPAGSVSAVGLLQSYQGAFTCNHQGNLLNPCPYDQIFQMIYGGVNGTGDWPGLAGYFNNLKTCDGACRYYKTAMHYSIAGGVPMASSKREVQSSSLVCYASNVANRLLGWVMATNQCLLPKSST